MLRCSVQPPFSEDFVTADVVTTRSGIARNADSTGNKDVVGSAYNADNSSNVGGASGDDKVSAVTELITPLSDRDHSSTVVKNDRKPDTLPVSVSDHDALREEQLADDSLKRWANLGKGKCCLCQH